MNQSDRMGIKNSIMHYLCDDWNNHKRGRGHKENQALFNRDGGNPIWTEIDLGMVMEKVVNGIWAYNEDTLDSDLERMKVNENID